MVALIYLASQKGKGSAIQLVQVTRLVFERSMGTAAHVATGPSGTPRLSNLAPVTLHYRDALPFLRAHSYGRFPLATNETT